MTDAAHLLLMSLGPVQDFIASARRCQDLWFGSWLLSELSAAIARDVGQRAGKEVLVFPGSIDDPDKPAVANKVLARLPAGANPREVANAAREAMMSRLGDVTKRAFDKVSESGFYRDVAEAQIADLMEIQWVAVPLENASDEAYCKGRARAERVLAARKNTRAWIQVDHSLCRQGGAVPKSALDGLRECVLDDRAYNLPAAELRRRYFVKRRERLCGPGLLKRVGEEILLDEEVTQLPAARRPVFHSTSHVASGPWRTRFAAVSVTAREPIDRYFSVLKELGVDLRKFRVRSRGPSHELKSPIGTSQVVPPTPDVLLSRVAPQGSGLDGYLLYEERLRDVLEASLSEDATMELEVCEEKARGALRKALRDLPAPSPYYAMILADGDRMGKLIDRVGSLEKHRKLGQALDAFSVAARHIVIQHAGSLVYSGGDDVLALLPLHTALACADALRNEFFEQIGGFAPANSELVPSLSVGVAVAHHLVDMRRVRELARRAERIAKQERNSLAIVVSKRSGPDLEVTGRWDEAGAGGNLRQRIDSWARLLLDVELPHGVGHELHQALAPLLADRSGLRTAGAPATVRAVASRVFARKRAASGSEKLATTTLQLLESLVPDHGDVLAAAARLAAELQITECFLEAYLVAFGAPERKETAA